MVKQIIFDRD